MSINWRRKNNAFYQRPNGSFVIESTLPFWQVAIDMGLLLIWLGYTVAAAVSV